MYDDSHSDRREPDRKDDEAEDRRPVVSEISRRGVVCRIEQYGCDEECQRDLGRYGERRCARKKREEGTAKREEDGIRGTDPACQSGQDYRREDETQQSFELTHVEQDSNVLRFWGDSRRRGTGPLEPYSA